MESAQHGPWISTHMFPMTCGNTVMDINTDPRCTRNTNADMVLNSQDVTITLVATQVTHTVWPWRQQIPMSPTWSQVADHTPGICTALSGIRSHGHQLRRWLWCVHRPRHGTQMKLRQYAAMTLCGSTDHSDLSGSGYSITLRSQVCA